MHYVSILGVHVSAVNMDTAGAIIGRWITQEHKTYVCVAPVSTIVDCQHDAEYRRIVNAAGMVTPDGMPVVWLARRQAPEVRRTYGPDLMRHLCRAGLALGWRHYFFGGTEENNARLREVLTKEFPGIQIAGMSAPPFRPHAQLEEVAVIEAINNSLPQIVWVGLGSPKQDFWMHLNRSQLQAPVLAGVGAAFDFLAGVKPQAPRWMQNTGLEWLFRLYCEPRRLWKRYLVGNSLFIFYLLKSCFTRSNIHAQP